jgi:hypothetical protein
MSSGDNYSPGTKDGLPDIILFNGIVFAKPGVSEANLEAFIKVRLGKRALNAYVVGRDGKRKRKKAEALNAQKQLLARNTARSLEASPKNSFADWTRPKWKTGGNPGLFVEGGDCCPK